LAKGAGAREDTFKDYLLRVLNARQLHFQKEAPERKKAQVERGGLKEHTKGGGSSLNATVPAYLSFRVLYNPYDFDACVREPSIVDNRSKKRISQKKDGGERRDTKKREGNSKRRKPLQG